jgi:hypothetical protein
MAQFHPGNFFDHASAKCREKYAQIVRRPTDLELVGSWRRARELVPKIRDCFVRALQCLWYVIGGRCGFGVLNLYRGGAPFGITPELIHN